MIPFRNTIIQGDCTKALTMLQNASIDFVLTDPPYVRNYRSKDGRTVRNDHNFAWLKPAFAEIHRVLKRDAFCVCFYGWSHVEKFASAFHAAGFRIVGHLSFPKPYVSGKRFLAYQHESAYLLAKGRPAEPSWALADIIPWKDFPKNELHPTEKPISILTPIIGAFSQPGQLVLDPFAGSGSTLMAAKTSGRDYIGIELDSEYHAIAKRRLAQDVDPALAIPKHSDLGRHP